LYGDIQRNFFYLHAEYHYPECLYADCRGAVKALALPANISPDSKKLARDKQTFKLSFPLPR